MTKTLIIDLDNTTCSMVDEWLRQYNLKSGENIKEEDIKDYNIRKYVKDIELLDNIIAEEHFFYNLLPLPNAIHYLQKLIDEGYDVVIATQPPRVADYAIKDKRKWIKKHLPSYDLSNAMYCHRKELLRGDVMFDDNPHHLSAWKKNNPQGIAVGIEWSYNKGMPCDLLLSVDKGWEDFYNFVKGLK